MGVSNVVEHAQKQYGKGPKNLKNRIDIYDYLVKGTASWWRFVFDKLGLKTNDLVLELGCGSGQFWRHNLPFLPAGLRVFLSDFSKPMLDAAKEALKGQPEFSFYNFDAEQIPFNAREFDKVMACHMLYHVPNIGKALAEIKRVLKRHGIFCCSGPSLDHLKEIRELAADFNKELAFTQSSAERFGLENASDILAEYFSAGQIKTFVYESTLAITSARAIVHYFGSIIQPEDESIISNVLADFEEHLNRLISQEGAIVARGKVGLFIVSNS